jgi:Nickel/cobalt transporter regulator
MLRVLAVVAMVALALPTLAFAQGHDEDPHHQGGRKPPPGRSGGGPSPGARPAFVPHGPPPGVVVGPHPGPQRGFVVGPHPGLPPGAMIGPHPGPVGPIHAGPGPAQFSYHGHMFNPVHVAPYAYPPGWGYRRWAVGAVLPPFFLAPDYYYADWAALGFAPPPPGTQWVRYGPDLLLVDVSTGDVLEVVPDVFY